MQLLDMIRLAVDEAGDPLSTDEPERYRRYDRILSREAGSQLNAGDDIGV